MPILGIWASQISGHLWAPSGAYDALASVTVGSGGIANITFTGIPTGYKHLQLRGSIRSDRSGEWDELILLQFNGDTGSNYSWHALDTSLTGSTIYAEAGSGSSTPRIVSSTGGASSSSAMNAMVIDILDYDNVNKYKTARSSSVWENNNYGVVWFGSMSWRNTAAITSLTIKPQYGTGFTQYSKLSLYGVK